MQQDEGDAGAASALGTLCRDTDTLELRPPVRCKVPPRSNGNKIPNISLPRAILGKDSKGFSSRELVRDTPRTASSLRDGTPRAAPPRHSSTKRTPDMALSSGAPVLAPLADIKKELLGSEMRQLIRDELQSTLSEYGLTAGGTETDSADGDEPDLVPCRKGSTRHSLIEDAQDALCLRTSSQMSDVYEVNEIRDVRSSPLMLAKGGISMLDVSGSLHQRWWDVPLLRAHRCLSSFGKSDPPPRTDLLSRIADSAIFENFIYTVIVLNMLVMTFEANYFIKSITSPREEIDRTFLVAEVFFSVLYLIEFVVKFWRCRWLYFYGRGFGWNFVDFLVLLVSIPALFQIDTGSEETAGKFVRILRFSKSLRALRLVAIVSKVNALMQSLTASVSTLLCSVGTLALFLFIFALFFVMRTAQALRERAEDMTATQESNLLESFGSVHAGMLSLLKATTGGVDWGDTFHILDMVGNGTQAVFVGFVVFCQIALLNVIFGMFVEQAMKVIESDKLEMAARHYQDQKDFTQTTEELLHLAGAVDGKISLEVWRNSAHKRRLYSYLDYNGFQPTEVDQYFELLAKTSVDETVHVHHFVNACIRMKGGASSFSVYQVMLAVSEIDEMLVDMQKQMSKRGPSRANRHSDNGQRKSQVSVDAST